MADPTRKLSDVALLYAEDPVNDPGGGWKTRSRTIEKSYRPDLDQLANAWMCVSGPDGTGTFKVQQKDLPKVNPLSWMLAGENEGIHDHWHSAKLTVGDYLQMNGSELPGPGEAIFIDLEPDCTKDPCLNHITDPSSAGWAHPQDELHFKAEFDGPYEPEQLYYRWSTGNAGVITIISDNRAADVRFKFIGTNGSYASLQCTATDPYGKQKVATLMMMGQSPIKDMPAP